MHVDSITSFLKVEWNSLPEIENLIQGALKCCVCVCICVCVLCKNTFFPFLPFKKLASIEDQEGGWCQDYLEVGPLVAAETITLLVWSQECLTSPAKSPLPKPPKSKNVIVSKGKMITPVQIGFQGKKHPEGSIRLCCWARFFLPEERTIYCGQEWHFVRPLENSHLKNGPKPTLTLRSFLPDNLSFWTRKQLSG